MPPHGAAVQGMGSLTNPPPGHRILLHPHGAPHPMTLTTCWLTPDRFQDYIAFTQQIYPQRRHVAERFRQQVLENPFLGDKTRPAVLLACTETGVIVGHYGLSPARFHRGGREQEGFSGFDFLVLPEHRQSGVGRQLAAEALSHEPYFGIGATPVAEHIYLKLGATTVGHMHRFFWLRGPLQWLYLAGDRALRGRWFRQPAGVGDMARLPAQVSGGGASWTRRAQWPDWADAAWSPEVITFSRSTEFLTYRFLQHPQHYQLYAAAAGHAYFVARRYHWRGLALLCLVDYRLPREDATTLAALLTAAKHLARAGRFDGVVVYSSLHVVDARLQKSGFRRMGQPTIIVAKGGPPVDAARIAARDYILATLADCDQDFAIFD